MTRNLRSGTAETAIMAMAALGAALDARLVRFAMVGGLGAAIRLLSMYLFVDVAAVHYLVAYAISFGVVVASNYTLNSLWTFPERRRGVAELLRYLAVCLLALALQEAVMYLLTGTLGVWYIFSTMAAIGIGFIINYTLSKRYVWNRERMS